MDELLVVRRHHDGAHLALTAVVCAVSASVLAEAVRLDGRGVRGERERSL